MTHPTATRPYEAPRIDERTKIDVPLVLTVASAGVPG